jgi:[ribosomal protein S18]-alanine N-acetyltransferase
MTEPAEKITIRQLEWSDKELEQILEIDALCFNSYDAYTVEDYRRWYGYNPDLCLVAIIDGRVAGDMLTKIVAEKAELGSMATHPDYRRLGVGVALLDETVRRVMSYGISIIDLEVRKTNFGGFNFWKKMGFRETGETPEFYGDGETAINMRKITK